MLEVKPPALIPGTEAPIVFLGGSIDMGRASDWRGIITRSFKDTGLVFLNPWGDNFDANTPQKADNAAFSSQVNWELDGLELADILVFYFEPGGKSPVSMLELGLYANTTKLVIVCCPDGFWRKGNVDIVCSRYQVTQVSDLAETVQAIMDGVTALRGPRFFENLPCPHSRPSWKMCPHCLGL